MTTLVKEFGRFLLPAYLNYLNSHHLQLTRAHLYLAHVFALGIVAETPQAQRGVVADSPTRRGTPKLNYELKITNYDI